MSTASTTAIPTDHAKFKTWADAECVTWPEGLIGKSHNAWWAMTGHQSHPMGEIDDFDAAYRAHVLSGSSA